MEATSSSETSADFQRTTWLCIPGLEPRSCHVGFVEDEAELGHVFSKRFGFSCHSFNTHHHPSSGAGTIGQIVADVPRGFSLTPHQEIKKKKKHCHFVNLRSYISSFSLFESSSLIYENRMNPVVTSSFFKIYFNIILASTSVSTKKEFSLYIVSHKFFAQFCIFPLLSTCLDLILLHFPP
jgi:hypothetical protein